MIRSFLKKKRGWIPAAIVLFWLIMTGLLVWREVIIPGSHTGSVTRSMNRPTDVWMGVYAGENERVGFINMRSMPEIRNEGTGVMLNLMARIDLPVFGRVTDLTLTGKAWVLKGQGLREFDFSFTSGDTDLRIEGRVDDGLMTAQLHTGNELIPLEFPISRDLLLSGGMGLPSLDVPLLEPGQEIYVDAFDPTTMNVGKVRIYCEGKETLEVFGEAIETYVIQTEMSGFTSRAWVTAEEEVIRAETPFGFSLRRISPQEALQPVKPDATADLIQTFAVRPDGKMPKRGAKRMRIRLGGLEENQLPPDEPLQRREGDAWLIQEPAAPGADDEDDGLTEEARQAALASDPIIQSDHEKILNQARKITGEESGRWNKALKIYEWVYNTIRKEAVISVPSALEVLQTKTGDCNEHTVLFTALARAAEIPTRVAIGIVWSDELRAFGYHAWPEVYAGQWIPMDPTLGQPLADATHLKLLNGSIDQWSRLVAYIGRIRMEVLEVE